MYEQYFGFSRTPFRLESEPDMFFFGESQKNVLSCITTSLGLRKGIITLSGLPGSGKTTVMRRAIEDSILPDSIICRINRSRCGDFLATLKQEIFIRQKKYTSRDYDKTSLRELVKNTLAEKKHYLIVVDESQQLTSGEVDELFFLVNIETDSLKHFKFLLVSHEPFKECFDITQYKNYSELVSNHCFLLPLLNTEIIQYIEHRLSNTGWSGSPSFSAEIESAVFLITQGIPRRINSFFDRLMLFSYFESTKKIDLAFIKLFCCDLLFELEHETHPDLDSFDLRQALRREKRLFADVISPDLLRREKELVNEENKKSIPKLPLDEPLSSEDPEEIIAFVNHFINNPERYKNYTDPYYKLPKNLTLLLCLATETDQYIDDVTPLELSRLSAVNIKEMIAIFIEKMLITSRSEPSRILGLDDKATEDEINRHFSYMMRLCRSEHLKTDGGLLCKKVKDAYIKLLSADAQIEGNEIPVIVDVLRVEEKSISEILDGSPISKGVEEKVKALEKARLASEAGLTGRSAELVIKPSRSTSIQKIKFKFDRKKVLLPASIASLVAAVSLGFIFIGGEPVQKPEFDAQPLALPDANVLANSANVEQKQTRLNDVVKKSPSIKRQPDKKKVKSTRSTDKKSKPKASVVAKNRSKKKKQTPKKTVQKIAKTKKKTIIANSSKKLSPKSLSTAALLDDEKELERVLNAELLVEEESLTNQESANQNSFARNSTNTFESIEPTDVNTFLIPSQTSPKNDLQSNAIVDDKTFLEKIELGRVLSNFKFGYESGDIDELTTLFTENAVSNDGFNREQILDDYDLLFDESDSRSIKITDVKWTINGNTATGIGRFSISIVDLDEVTQNDSEGKITFKVIESDETKKITELFFLHQFVEAQ